MDRNTPFENGAGSIRNRPAFNRKCDKNTVTDIGISGSTKWIRGGKIFLYPHIRTGGQVMGKELAEMIEENRIVYYLEEDGCYYPDLRLPEKHTII